MASMVARKFTETWTPGLSNGGDTKCSLSEVVARGGFEELTSGLSVTELEALLMEEHGELMDLASEARAEVRMSIFEVSPFGPLTLRVFERKATPSQAFVALMEEADLGQLLSCRRVLSDHLALAVNWDIQGQPELAASLMGLLLRLGVAGGAEDLVVRTVTRLGDLHRRCEKSVEVSMGRESLKKIRKAWRVWGSSPQTSHPQTLMRLARIIRRNNEGVEVHLPEHGEPGDELDLDEIAVLERLMAVATSPTFKLAPGQQARAMLRLMELYGSSPVGWAETSRRGLDLVPLWAEACVERSAPPRHIDHVVQLALFFERQLRAAGATGSRALLAARLHQALYHLSRRWYDHPPLAGLTLHVGKLQRELLGDDLDTTALERIARLFSEGERLASRDRMMRGQLREAHLEVVGVWLSTGDPAASVAARHLMDSAVGMESSVPALVGLCRLYLNMPGTERQRQHNAHRCRQLADQALSHVDIETMPVQNASALLLKSLASIEIHATLGQRSSHNTLGWLRRAVALLTRQLKRSRTDRVQLLLGQALLALAHVQMGETDRWEGLTRSRLLARAQRDGLNAEHLFRSLGRDHFVAESLWVQGRIHMMDKGQEASSDQRVRMGLGIECVKGALAVLGNTYGVQQYTGQHTGRSRLGDLLRHDLVQFSTLLAAAPQPAITPTLIRVDEVLQHRSLDRVEESRANRKGATLIESAPSLRAIGPLTLQIGAVA